MKILITDSLLRKSNDIYNILLNNYSKKELLLLNTDSSFFSKITINIIYITKCRSLRKGSAKQFFKDLKTILQKKIGEKIVYVPIEEDTTLLFYEFINNNKFDNLRYLLPSEKNFKLVRDKKKFSNFCQKNNFPVPKEFDKSDINNLKNNFTSLIIKPKIGSGSLGIKYINNINDLYLLDEIDFEEYIVQEKLSNPKDVLGAFYLFENGKIVSYYGHKRIRTYPIEGGVTVYSKISFNEQIKKMGENLLSKLNWSGFAMIEFLFDERVNEYKIIEVNPRLWGSILLSEFANTKFIRNYINLSIGVKEEKSEVRKDVYIRWLFPFDFFNYIKMKGQIDKFWSRDKNVCHINFTYSSLYRSILFIMLNIISPIKIFKLIRKLIN